MEINIKFKSMFINYLNSDKDDCPKKIDFLKSIKSHSLSSIDFIYTEYIYQNKNCDLYLRIKKALKGSQNIWNVYYWKNDKFFFSFEADEPKVFLEIFEKRLKKELDKIEIYEYNLKYPEAPKNAENQNEPQANVDF